MVRLRYLGLVNPSHRLEALSPARDALIAMLRAYAATSPEHRALGDAISAVDNLAKVIANEPELFLSRRHSAG